MKLKTSLIALLVIITTSAQAQSFTGIYSSGDIVFKAKYISDKSKETGLYNIEYTKGDKKETTVVKTSNPEFEYVFQEYEGTTHLGTFYFIRSWKGIPSEGYYVSTTGKEKIPVKFIKKYKTNSDKTDTNKSLARLK